MRTVGVKFVADVTGFKAGVAQAASSTKQLAGELDKTSKAGKLDKVADQAARFGLIGVAAFAGVVKASADFDKQMSAVSAATHASAGDMGQLRAAALQAGKDTQYSATQAADGITQLAKAGVSTADILGGGLKGALDLAAAGQLSVGDAAETAATAITQFQLRGAQLPHVADVLAAAAGKAQGSVGDMSVALKYAGLPAHNLGISLEETAGTLALFAKNGLIGEQAGTGFRGVLASLTGPSSKAADRMKDLGIQVYGANGKFVGMTGVAEQLRVKLGGVSAAQRDAALATIFGRENLQAAIILMNGGASAVKQWTNGVNDAGYATESAAKLTDNLAGDIERLKGSLETLAISSGSGANSGIRILTKGLNGLVNQFLGLPGYVGSSMTVLAGVGGVAALALAGFIKLRKGLAEAVTQLTAMGPAGEKAASGLQKTASAAGKAAVGFIALEGAAAVLNSFGRHAVDVNGLTASLTNLANTGKVAGAAAESFGTDLSGINMDAAVATSGVAKWLDKVEGFVPIAGDAMRAASNLGARIAGKDDYQTAMQNWVNLDQALVNFMTTTNDARKSGDLWNQILLKSGLNTEQLAKLMPDAWTQLQKMQVAAHAAGGATRELGNAASDAKQPELELKSAADAVAAAAGGQRSALVFLSKALADEFNPVQALISAQKEFKQKQDAAAEAVKRHGRNSKEARAASLDLASAALNLTGRVGALSGSFNGKLSPAMLIALHNAHLTKGQINDVERAFKDAKKSADKFDGNYRANVSIRGDRNVGQRLDRLRELQEQLKAGKNISVANKMGKVGFGYAGGGWTGPGAKDQPAGVVHADEYVIRKESRQSIERRHPGALDKMNITGRLPGYAGGGVVGWPFPATAGMTRVPSKSEAMSAVTPAAPSGGQTYKWMEAVVRAAFPGMRVLSDFRPGARTLSGNLSYHALGRAVDFPPSLPLAEWINYRYKSRTKELITPWNSLNIWNGQRHTYTGAVYRQHNFAGGNAHDHWAMQNGGRIGEPVWGVGKSGDTYSFGERGPEYVIPDRYITGSGGGSSTTYAPVYNVNVTVPGTNATPQQIASAVSRELGRQADVYARAG